MNCRNCVYKKAITSKGYCRSCAFLAMKVRMGVEPKKKGTSFYDSASNEFCDTLYSLKILTREFEMDRQVRDFFDNKHNSTKTLKFERILQTGANR